MDSLGSHPSSAASGAKDIRGVANMRIKRKSITRPTTTGADPFTAVRAINPPIRVMATRTIAATSREVRI